MGSGYLLGLKPTFHLHKNTLLIQKPYKHNQKLKFNFDIKQFIFKTRQVNQKVIFYNKKCNMRPKTWKISHSKTLKKMLAFTHIAGLWLKTPVDEWMWKVAHEQGLEHTKKN